MQTYGMQKYYFGFIGFVTTQVIQPLSYHFIIDKFISSPQQSALFDITQYQYNIYKFHHWSLWFDLFYIVLGVNSYHLFKEFNGAHYKVILYQMSWYCRYLIQYFLVLLMLSFLPDNNIHFELKSLFLVQNYYKVNYDEFDIFTVQAQIFQAFQILYILQLLKQYFNIKKVFIVTLISLLLLRLLTGINFVVYSGFIDFDQYTVMGQGIQQLFGAILGYYYALERDSNPIFTSSKSHIICKPLISDLIILVIFMILYFVCQFVSQFELHEISISNTFTVFSYTFARPSVGFLYIVILYFLESSNMMRYLINNQFFQYLQTDFDYISTAFILFSKTVKAYIQDVEFGPFDDIIVMFLKNGVIVITIILGSFIAFMIKPILAKINSYLSDIEQNLKNKQSYTIYNKSFKINQ